MPRHVLGFWGCPPQLHPLIQIWHLLAPKSEMMTARGLKMVACKAGILEYPKNNITDRKNTLCIWSNYPGDSEFVCSELSTSCRRVINPIWACSSFDLQNVAGKFQSLPFFSNQTLTCSWASHTVSVVTRAYISRWVNVCVWCDILADRFKVSL